VPIASEMNPARTPAVAALAAGGALLCAVAALVVRRLGADPWPQAAIVAAVGLSCAAGTVYLERVQERQRRARAQRAQELSDHLDVAGSEAQSRALLLGHVQRVLPEAGAAVLTCVESEGRLEPAYGERVADTPLRGLLVGRPTPETCLAVRLGRPHRRGLPNDGFAGCELCGRLVGESICEPLRTGGRTLGALLVATVDPITSDAEEELHEAVRRTAPMLALARTVAVAEHHAARDPLTGLPNRRAADDALSRLSAQAGRTVTPLAAVLVDLDRFAAVNDRFGNEHGDGALSAIAQTLLEGVRASDLLSRYGGQTFLVLAPDTDRRGAAELAEKLRRDVEGLSPAGVGRITASFGVASVPEDAAGADGLMRRAERALGIAKALGRNRVAGPEPSAASDV
jgi:diguanylate cyclase (GGDEF)-like protein